MSHTASDRALEGASAAGHSLFVSAQDGLRLHVRAHGARTDRALPAVCLPGLARTTADFDTLAVALANDRERPRRVLALDYRGRGKSDYDRKPANYNLQVELADVLSVLTALGIGRAAFVGTSRGGILTMLLAAQRPTLIAGAVFNDIGPVLELQGLVRIKGYVGRLPPAKSFEEGADILRWLFSGQFPKLTSDDWLADAKRTFREQNGRLVPTYDPALAKTLEGVDVERPQPPLWNAFAALGRVPLMVIRGANSDILSAATVETMQAHHPGLTAIEIPDEGHPPRLSDPELIGRIAAFVALCDQPQPH
jgi:pimeloyl-ACP methyl ester carboxylesterase